MTTDELKAIDSLTRALWALERRLASASVPVQAAMPRQAELPGLADGVWEPPKIQPPPRTPSNVEKIYRALWGVFGDETVARDALRTNVDIPALMDRESGGRIAIGSLPKILTEMAAVGALRKIGRREVRFTEPTDEVCRALAEEHGRKSAREEGAA